MKYLFDFSFFFLLLFLSFSAFFFYLFFPNTYIIHLQTMSDNQVLTEANTLPGKLYIFI